MPDNIHAAVHQPDSDPGALPPPDQGWAEQVAWLAQQVDLAATAQTTRALLRKREIKQASDLLRMVLAYAVCDWSLRQVGIGCTVLGLGNLSDVALYKRLRQCEQWLGTLLGALWLPVMQDFPPVTVRLLDATSISRPGSTGTDWRVHLSWDLGCQRITGIELTDAHGAESLARFPVQPGEIRVGDRGYAYANSLGPVLAAQGAVVVRINGQNFPVLDADHQALDLFQGLQALTPGQQQEQAVWLLTPPGCFPLRLLITALPPERAAVARQRLRKA